MELTELEHVVGNYKRFVCATSDNLYLEGLYISYLQEFDSIKVLPQYPSVVNFYSSETHSSLALWNVRRVNIITTGTDHDTIVFTVLANGLPEREAIKIRIDAYPKT